MIPMTILQAIFWATTLPMLAAAFAFGAREERLGMSIIVAGSVATAIFTPSGVFTFDSMAMPIFISDTVILLALVWLCFSSQKYWPIWVASLQLITVAIHLVELAIPQTVPKAYAIIQGFWVYPMFIAIAGGIYGHAVLVRRKRVTNPTDERR